MDDYSLSSLTESKNEWCARLVSILTHHVVIGIESIFSESLKLCEDNYEEAKYLMTFQNLLTAIPNWNENTINIERKRIEAASGCKYLEDLITCVHIIQLKALTCIRVGQKQKKIDVDIPSVDKFVHQIYINVARRLYTNIYLFEKDLYPLQMQKNKYELERLIKEAILTTIRDNIPVERILQCYMEENEEVEFPKDQPKSNNLDTNELMKEASVIDEQPISKAIVDVSLNPVLSKPTLESLAKEIKENPTPSLVEPKVIQNELNTSVVIPDTKEETKNLTESVPLEPLSINFSDKDMVVEGNGTEVTVEAPKDLDTLEKKAEIAQAKRKQEEAEEESLKIGEDVSLDITPISLDITEL